MLAKHNYINFFFNIKYARYKKVASKLTYKHVLIFEIFPCFNTNS